MIDDVYHSDIEDYVGTMLAMRELDVSVVHGGHFPSFGKVRYRQLIDEYARASARPAATCTAAERSGKRSLKRPLRTGGSRGVAATGSRRLRPLAHLFRMSHQFGEHQRETSHHQEDYDQTRYRQ